VILKSVLTGRSEEKAAPLRDVHAFPIANVRKGYVQNLANR
jgi:hypothetical protein